MGPGTASDDLADACVFLMRRWDSPDIINVGVGEDVSIAELAELVRSDRGDVPVVSRQRRHGVAVGGAGA
jgi:UDP-glucose 4-epimerase